MDIILVLDVENTNIALGVYEGTELIYHWRIQTIKDRTADEHWLLLKSLFADVNFDANRLQGIIISSVVPPLMTVLEEMCQRYFRKQPLVVGPGMKTGLPIKYENPREVGADRIVNAVAAVHLFGPPLIVVNFGTATTFCVIDDHGQYLGGVIAPGIKISTEALFERAAKLPKIELVKPKTVIGRSTVASMQSGVIYGFASQVDGIVNHIREELPLPFQVIATGGLADLVSRDSRVIHHTVPFLSFEGLRILWERNTQMI